MYLVDRAVNKTCIIKCFYIITCNLRAFLFWLLYMYVEKQMNLNCYCHDCCCMRQWATALVIFTSTLLLMYKPEMSLSNYMYYCNDTWWVINLVGGIPTRRHNTTETPQFSVWVDEILSQNLNAETLLHWPQRTLVFVPCSMGVDTLKFWTL